MELMYYYYHLKHFHILPQLTDSLHPAIINQKQQLTSQQLIITFTTMQSMLLFFFVVLVAATGSTLGESNCTKSYYFDVDCCNIVGTTAEFSKEIIENCTRTSFSRHIGQPPRFSEVRTTTLISG